MKQLSKATKGYSFADITALVKDAAMGPIRDHKNVMSANKDNIRPVMFADFKKALNNIHPSVSQATI